MEKINEYLITNYQEEDAQAIGQLDVFKELAYRHHRDYSPSDVVCVKSKDGTLLGVGHVSRHDSWHSIEDDQQVVDFVHKLQMEISVSKDSEHPKEIKQIIFDRLLKRSKEIRKHYPKKIVKLVYFTSILLDESEQSFTEDANFLTENGMVLQKSYLRMEYDLSKEIPIVETKIPVEIRNLDLKEHALFGDYHNGLKEAFYDSGVWSKNHLMWMMGAREWRVHAAYSNNQLVGGCFSWAIGEDKGATEEVFTLAPYRSNGVANKFICSALSDLKQNGKKKAWLACHGDNKAAIKLYRSIGYEIIGTFVEFGMEI